MATLSKPLISAAALAGAAAVAVATPAIMPPVGVPTPGALSRAAYELTTFSDVLSIPAVVWTDVLFGNQSWGNTLSATSYGPAWAKPTDALGQPYYINPWAGFCGGKCSQVGFPGVGYMFTDALINGNGNGYADYDNWPVGIVNYFWEPATASLLGGGSSPTVQYSQNGFSAATWYALQELIGKNNPDLQVPIAAAFWGADNVAVFYNLALSLTAAAVKNVPGVGPITSNSILAYLGDLPIPGTTDYYQYGLSGVLNYWVDIADGSVPFPTGSFAPVAPTAAAVAAPVRGASTAAPAVENVAATPDKPATIAVGEPAPSVEAPEVTPAADKKPADAPVVEVADSAPADDIKVDAPAVEAPADDIKVDVPAVEAPESNPAGDSKTVDATDSQIDAAVAETLDSAPASAPASSGSESSAAGSAKESSDSAAPDVSDAGAPTSDAGSADAGAAKSDAGSADAGAAKSDASDSAGGSDAGAE